MSLAEEMLATMPLSDDSSTYSADEEPHIVINESRQAIVPNELKTIAVTGDKDIETVTFDCVRYWDGNDLSTFAIYLNYVLPDNTPGTYIPKAITTSDGEDVYHFDWKIKNNITTKSGKISFAITAVKTKQSENGETVVDKQWSSLPNGDCSIALGLGISNVPTEEESSDVVAQLSAILEKIHGDLDEWIKTVVVQTTGTSKTQVMSQEAVTTSLNIYKVESIQQSNEYTDSKSNLLDKKIVQNSNKISRDSKRITNLEQGLPSEQFMTDSTVAYTKDVPSNALPYASINKIGGMTRKCANLITYPYVLKTSEQEGVTITVNDNGSVVLNGAAENRLYLKLCDVTYRAGVTYTLSGCPSGDNNNSYNIYDDVLKKYDIGSGITFNVDTDTAGSIYIMFDKGQTANNLTFCPMLNEGSTALPYELYFTGLRSAKVTEVKSVDVNLLDDSKVLSASNAAISNGTVTQIIADTSPTPIFKSNLFNGGNYIGTVNSSNSVTTIGRVGVSFTKTAEDTRIAFGLNGTEIDTLVYADVSNLPDGLYFISVDFTNVTQGSFSWKDMMINKGSTAKPYTPYVEHTLPIPEAVRNLGGYGEGNPDNAEEYNAIINEDGKWKYSHKGNIENNLWLPLATPEVTDISDLLSADNFLAVEGNGSITAVNEYGYDVPSEIEYQLEV